VRETGRKRRLAVHGDGVLRLGPAHGAAQAGRGGDQTGERRA
jgi:hypothetical protein